MFKPYTIGEYQKEASEEVLNELTHLGDVLASGEETIVLKPSFKTNFDAVLMITTEKEKLPFLKRLSKNYKNFFIEELNIGFLVSKMEPVILKDKETKKILRAINKEFKTVGNLDFKALYRISDIKIRRAIEISLKEVRDNNAYLDLHSLQFVKNNKEIICIDPVYYN